MSAWDVSDRRLGSARRLDVGGDLLDQGLLAVEGLLVAQALPKLEDEALAVQVAGKVEQERLHPPLVAAVVRVGADRDRRPPAPRRARVDAEGGDEQMRRNGQVGR